MSLERDAGSTGVQPQGGWAPILTGICAKLLGNFWGIGRGTEAFYYMDMNMPITPLFLLVDFFFTQNCQCTPRPIPEPWLCQCACTMVSLRGFLVFSSL